MKFINFFVPKTVGIHLLIFLIIYCIIFSVLAVLLAKGVIAFVGHLEGNISSFSWPKEFMHALKVGIAGGLPLGIGCWVLSKLDEKKKSSPNK
ncbi:MAG: hypothetical protein WCD24_03655 [Serratia inhibens]|uniref:hypothetical protein n=1 Tax=Serratia inhibens TaxID=2338073 RepID=UPI003C7EA632